MQTNQTSNTQLKKLPPLSYFFKVLLRHGFWAILITLPIAILIALGLSRIEISYPSKGTVIYDPRDSSITNTFALYPEFNQIGNIYLAALADKAFLISLGRRLGYFDDEAADYSKPWFQEFLANFLPETIIPQSWSYDEEEYKVHAIQSQIKERLKGRVTPNSYELDLEGRARSPEAAQVLVKEALNTFVEFQLREALAKIRSHLETLESYLQQEKRRIEDMADIYSIYDNSNSKSGQALNLTRQQKQQLKNQERNLINRILDKQGEAEQTVENQIQRKLELEAELQSLLTRRGPTHPDVVQKRGELVELERTRRTMNFNQEIEGLIRQLLQLQARLRRAGLPVDLTLQMRNMSEEGQLFIERLTQQVKEYRLEQQNLENQLNQIDARNRYRFSKAPSLETSPANKKFIAAAIAAGIMILLLTAGSVIVFREFFSPIATDAWRLINRYSLPVVSQFSKKDMKNLTQLNPTRIRQTKGRIDNQKLSGKDEQAIRPLQNTRFIEQAFVKAAVNGAHGLVFVGQHPDLGILSRTIGNCCAIDQDQGAILIDCNHTNPALTSRSTQDLHQFLNGDCKWKDVKIKAADQHAFDYAYHSLKAQNAEALKSATFKKLMVALKEKYQLVVLNGFPGGLFVENARLMQVADSWVLGVVLGEARYEDIEAALEAIDSSKLKGLVLIEA
ncbi:MAG: hypothetical protein ACOH5I_00875 [Oligoflexus sp.]